MRCNTMLDISHSELYQCITFWVFPPSVGNLSAVTSLLKAAPVTCQEASH